jgi:hypothetical protein
MLKMRLDPSVPKVIFIAVLLFLEGFMIPTYTVITQNRWPTTLEFCGFVISAAIQLITYLVVFLETGQPPPTPPPATNP